MKFYGSMHRWRGPRRALSTPRPYFADRRPGHGWICPCRRQTGRSVVWSFYIFMRFSTDSRTICGAGAFACQLVMFYRRKLPHWHPDLTEGTFLFVTWRLAGSVPQARLPRPPRSAPISAGRAFVILDHEVDK